MERVALTFDEVVNRARTLTRNGRTILGITGAPGAGKSTVAKMIVESLGPKLAALAPMDGFHLSNSTLKAEGKLARKGALDTFDGYGYLNLLARLRAQNEPVVHAPDYYRTFEESIGSAIPIYREVPLIVTEGNYLLFKTEPWGQVQNHLDESWFIELEENVRIARLIQRHIEVGKSPEEAEKWSRGSDQENALSVLANKDSADLVITILE